MTENHSRLRELFVAACDLPKSEQIELMDKQCSDDPELRRELERLLQNDLAGGLFVNGETAAHVQFEFDTKVEDELPKQIGEYRVKKILGQGGMGVVYLAQQQNPSRDVAIKVIRSGMVNPDLLKRFELEAAVLGRLTHPGVARIYEAGVFVDGQTGHERPFLAMEYVDGQPLREFVSQSNPGTRDRLRLFVEICNAVHHAHQRGVIHRDLKPGNVIVKANKQPCILDFGIARAIEVDAAMPTLKTREGQLIGTLPYMSPEQLSGHSLDVDTRSDVYALGVMVYELLTDKLPHDVSNQEYLKAARAISEDAPTPLSSISREFRGDLNTVVLKALEKDPDRRYQSAKAFANDVERFLDKQPVQARPATALYQLNQFAKRNKALVAGFLVSIALLVAGIIGTTIGMVNARNEASRKNAINVFMKDILITEDSVSGNPNIKMVEVLRKAADSAPERFRDYPELEAEVTTLLGDAFSKLTMYSDALPLRHRAYELRETGFGLSHPLTREAGERLANLLVNNDAAGTIELVNKLLDSTPANKMQGKAVLRLQMAMARAHFRLNEWDASEHILRDSLSKVNNHNDFKDGTAWELRVFLAHTLRHNALFGSSNDVDKDQRDAIELLRQAIDLATDSLGKQHGYTLQTKLKLADALSGAEQLEDASQLCEQVLELASDHYDAEHTLNVRPKRLLARIRFQQENYDEAASYATEVIELCHRRTGVFNISVMAVMVDGFPILEAACRYAKGEEYARVMLEKLSGRNSSYEIPCRLYLARFLSGQGKTTEAEKEFKLIKASGKLNSKDNTVYVYSLFMGEHCLANGERIQAAKLFEEALLIRRQLNKKVRPTISRVEDSIARAKAAVDNEK